MKKETPRIPQVFDRHLFEHDLAVKALAKAKAMEKKLKKKLVSVRLDDRTVLTTTADRVDELTQDYKHTK